MSAAIGPGDYVEYVGIPNAGAEVGRVYLIYGRRGAGTVCSECADTGPAFLLKGASHPAWIGYCHCELKPVYRPKQELLSSLLTDVHDRVPA
jgi:hypothetical protein